MPYNVDIVVNYADDFSYRQSIRDVFGMSVSMDPYSDYDEVTQDELLYEGGAMSEGLDDIYAKTKDSPDFQQIYLTCAGFMLSMDPSIGLAVVFSYDFFDRFHPCLVDFMKSGSISDDNRKNLMKKISR